MALFLIESFSICFSEFKNAIKYRIYIYLGGQFSQENCIGVTLGCQFSKEIALGLHWGVNLDIFFKHPVALREPFQGCQFRPDQDMDGGSKHYGLILCKRRLASLSRQLQSTGEDDPIQH